MVTNPMTYLYLCCLQKASNQSFYQWAIRSRVKEGPGTQLILGLLIAVLLQSRTDSSVLEAMIVNVDDIEEQSHNMLIELQTVNSIFINNEQTKRQSPIQVLHCVFVA